MQAAILELLPKQKERTRCSYVLTSHDLAVVRQIADEIIVMIEREVQEAEPIEPMFRDPAHPYTRP